MSIDDTSLRLLIDGINHRLDHQDNMLAEVLGEVKRTNGRVTALETVRAVVSDREQRQVRRTDTLRWRFEILLGGACILVGGALGDLLHAIGL